MMTFHITKRDVCIICSVLALTLLPLLVWYQLNNPLKHHSFIVQTSDSKVLHRMEIISSPTPNLSSALPLSRSVSMSHSIPSLPLAVSPSPVEYPSSIKTDCSSVHVAMVASGEIGSSHLYMTIKSVLMYRSTPLHFHFITDDRAKTVLQTMMSTWLVPAVSHDYYDLAQVLTSISSNSTDSQIHCSSQSLSIHLNLDLILPNTIQHVIVIEPASVVTVDLAQLSALTQSRGASHRISVCQTKCALYNHNSNSEFELTKWGAVGVNLQKQVVRHESIWMQKGANIDCSPNAVDIVDELFKTPSHDTLKKIPKYDGELLRYKKMEKCPEGMKPLVHKAPSKRDECKLFEWERKAHRRELPFLLGHSYKSSGDHDVTMTTHLDYNRLNLLERILVHWDGPTSVAIHVTDSQVQGVLDFLLNSKSLQHRKNVFYHLLFRVGPSYPPNHGRELAHRFVSTPYMFILDVDYVPSYGLYKTLMERLKANAFGDINKTAVVIPAFETDNTNFKIPHSKSIMVQYFQKHKVYQFHHSYFYPGHGPTNYYKWKSTSVPYFVSWKNDYEPYYLIKTSVFSFDHRFVARFQNKASHSTELHMAGYEFLVFPDSFVVHLPHKKNSQNMGDLRKCSRQWYRNWLKEKRKQHHYTKKDIRDHLVA